MGKCLHGLHDVTFQMEWNGCHFGNNQLIFEVGENGSNKDYHNNV
jgi:hypothetical protein